MSAALVATTVVVLLLAGRLLDHPAKKLAHQRFLTKERITACHLTVNPYLRREVVNPGLTADPLYQENEAWLRKTELELMTPEERYNATRGLITTRTDGKDAAELERQWNAAIQNPKRYRNE